MKSAFTLVELLIVLLLMGIIYGLLFGTILSKDSHKASSETMMQTIESIFTHNSDYKKTRLILYCTEHEGCMLSDMRTILKDKIDLRENGIGYRLNQDETLQQIEYPHLHIGTKEFKPLFSISCRKNGLFDPQIIRTKRGWIYIKPFGKPSFFLDAVTMVQSIRQSDYLPDRSGYAR